MRISSKIPFFLPLTLFFLSGIVGVWSSYSPGNSLVKFLLITSGILLYAATVVLRGENHLLTMLTWIFLTASALLALYFTTQYNFPIHPSKFNVLNQFGVQLRRLLPQLQLFNLERDVVVGILEIALPLNIAAIIDVWTHKHRISISLTITLLIILFGLLMTSSMRSLIALVTVASIALAAYLVIKFRERIAIWVLVAVILAAGILVFILLNFSNLSSAQISGRIDSQIDLNLRTWQLIQSYFFTGSGLDVFSMVLSSYNLLIHVPFAAHAENTFLQIWIEQGLLGFIAFIWFVCAFYVWVWNHRNHLNELAIGALAATTTMLFHDMIDVRLYSTIALPLMFLPIGLTVASTENLPVQTLSKIWNRQRIIGAFIIILSGLVLGWNLIISAWYTNLGSVSQTRLELSQYKFPYQLAEYTRREADYSKIELYFRQALAVDPCNIPANQRLAMLALEREEYVSAIKLLKKAYARNSSDPVTLQLLGATYLGRGCFDEAYTFWSRLPDAPKKLELEAWIRYGTRGDNERAYQARKLAIKIMGERRLNK